MAALVMPIAPCSSQLKWIRLASRARRLEDFEDFYELGEATRGPLGSAELLYNLRFGRGFLQVSNHRTFADLLDSQVGASRLWAVLSLLRPY